MFRHPISICRARSLGFLRVFSGCSRLLRGRMGLWRKAKPADPRCGLGCEAKPSSRATPGTPPACVVHGGSGPSVFDAKPRPPLSGPQVGSHFPVEYDQRAGRRCQNWCHRWTRIAGHASLDLVARKSGDTIFPIEIFIQTTGDNFRACSWGHCGLPILIRRETALMPRRPPKSASGERAADLLGTRKLGTRFAVKNRRPGPPMCVGGVTCLRRHPAAQPADACFVGGWGAASCGWSIHR